MPCTSTLLYQTIKLSMIPFCRRAIELAREIGGQ